MFLFSDVSDIQDNIPRETMAGCTDWCFCFVSFGEALGCLDSPLLPQLCLHRVAQTAGYSVASIVTFSPWSSARLHFPDSPPGGMWPSNRVSANQMITEVLWATFRHNKKGKSLWMARDYNPGQPWKPKVAVL